MRKRGRLITGFAALGFAIAAIIYASIAFTPVSDPPSRTEIFLGVISVVLCPSSLLSIPLFDIEPYTIPGVIVWFTIGLINSALYAAIGAVVARFVRNTDPELPQTSNRVGG
jgi:hypothetical protein